MTDDRPARRPARTRKKDGPGLATLLSFALRELIGRHRLFTTFVMVVVASLAVNHVVIPGYYGSALYEFQRGEMDKRNARQIVADCTDPGKRDMFFTAQSIEKLRQDIPQITGGAERIELGVNASMGGSHLYVPAESTVPGEFDERTHRFSRGGGVRSAEGREVVLPEFMYNKLLKNHAPGWDANSIRLSVSRPGPDGQAPEEVSRIFQIAGVLRYRRDEKIYVPLETLRAMDMWCGHAILSLKGAEDGDFFPCTSCRTFVSESVPKSQFESDVRHLKIDAKEVGDVEFLSCLTRPWVRIERKSRRPFTLDDLGPLARDFPAVRAALPALPCTVATSDANADATLVAVRPADPMLEKLRGVAALRFSACLISDRLAKNMGLRGSRGETVSVCNGRDRLPAVLKVKGIFPHGLFHAEIVCDPETFAFVATKVDTGQVKARGHAVPELAHFVTLPGVRVESGRTAELMQAALLADSTAGAYSEWLEEYRILGKGRALANRRDFPTAREGDVITLNGRTDIRLKWADEIPLPRGVILLSKEHVGSRYRLAAIRLKGQSEGAGAGTFPWVNVLSGDLQRHARMRKAFADAGHKVVPLGEVHKLKLIRYEVTDSLSKGSRISKAVLNAIKLTKPTFIDALPNLKLPGYVGSMGREAIPLVGSAPHDPLRYGEDLVAGGWLPRAVRRFDPKDPQAVVLPASALVDDWRAVKSGEFSKLIGDVVKLRFYMEGDAPGRLTPGNSVIDVRCRITAFTSSDTGYIPMDFARTICLWRTRQLKFDPKTRTFTSGKEIYARTGTSSCKLYVGSWDHVRPVADRLEAMGYRVQSSLTQQEGLRRLGTALRISSLLVCVGPVLLSLVVILAMTWMVTSKHLHETGVIMVYGATKKTLLKIYLLKGVMIGLLSFALGFGTTVLLEPHVVRPFVKTVFHTLPFDEVLRTQVYHLGNWHLFALALAVSLGFSVLGVCAVAAHACSTSLWKLLRRKE